MTLVIVDMHVINLGYLEDRPPCFMKLPDGGTKELSRMLVRLDTITVIPEIDKQNPPYLINLEVEQANKKKEKAEKCRQRKIILAQTAIGGDCTLLSPVASARPPLSSPSGSALSSPVTSASCFFSLIACSDPLSTVSSRPLSAFSCHSLSYVTGGDLMSVVSGRPLFFITSRGLLSTIFGHHLSAVTSDDPLFIVFNDSPSSFMPLTGS